MPTCKIQKIATKFSEGDSQIKILFLPVEHPELSPIETVWLKIKREVANKSSNFYLSTM